MPVLPCLLRKNIYREIPGTGCFWQKVLADFTQVLVKCFNSNSVFLTQNKFSHYTCTNTNHLLSLTKASGVDQSQSESWKSRGFTYNAGGHICFISAWMSCHRQPHLQLSDQEQDTTYKNHTILANNWYCAIPSDPTLPQIIVRETKFMDPTTVSTACALLHFVCWGNDQFWREMKSCMLVNCDNGFPFSVWKTYLCLHTEWGTGQSPQRFC